MTKTTITQATTLLVMMTAALGGCANKHLTFEKSGVSPADVQRDQNECLVTAMDSGESAKILVPHVDHDAVIRCMEARGYTLGSK
jgi:hypothetical protein